MANSRPNRSRHPHRSVSARRQIVRPPRNGSASQAALAAMRGALEKAGLDLTQFEEMRAQSRAELRKALAGYRAAANERAPAMHDVVARSGEHWLKSNRVVSALAPADNFYSVGAATRLPPRPTSICPRERSRPWLTRFRSRSTKRASP